MTRQEANLKILDMIREQVENQPDIRFGQLLRNMSVIYEVRNQQGFPVYWGNEFNLESTDLLERMEDLAKLWQNFGKTRLSKDE